MDKGRDGEGEGVQERADYTLPGIIVCMVNVEETVKKKIMNLTVK